MLSRHGLIFQRVGQDAGLHEEPARMEVVRLDRRSIDLANEVSDAIVKVTKLGLPLDETLCLVVQVVADYARQDLTEDFIEQLANVMRARMEMPLPESIPLATN